MLNLKIRYLFNWQLSIIIISSSTYKSNMYLVMIVQHVETNYNSILFLMFYTIKVLYVFKAE